MANKNFLIGIDIGSFTTKGILFQTDGAYYSPLVYDTIQTSGIINGEIQDVEAIRSTVENLLDSLAGKLEQATNKKLKDFDIVIGYSTNELQTSSEIFTTEFQGKTEIQNEDITRIKKNIFEKYSEEGKIALDISFKKFIVDDKTVKNPVAFIAQKSLTSYLNIVWVPENSFALLKNVFSQLVSDSEIPIYDTTLSLAYITTNANSRNIGTAVVELGYSKSRVIIFKNGIPKHFFPFHYGMRYVLKDISAVLKTPEEEAYRLIKDYAVCMRDTKTVKKIDFKLMSGSNYGYTSLNLLNKIVYSRMREIVNKPNSEISKINQDKSFEIGSLSGGIVYAGGGAKVKNIEQTIKELMGENFRPARVESQIFTNIPDEILKDHDYVSVFGLIDRYNADKNEYSTDRERPRGTAGNMGAKAVNKGIEKNTSNKGFFKNLLGKLIGGNDDAL